MEPTSLPPYLSAAEAAQLLNIRKDTLYAYVSRGRLRSIEIPNQKARGYLRDDVERLQQAKTLRQQPEATVQKALHWGVPLLKTQISHLSAGVLYYRHLPLDQVIKMSLEVFLSHLWQKPELQSPGYWSQIHPPLNALTVPRWEHLNQLFPPGSTWLNKVQMLLPLWAVADHSPACPERLLLQFWQAVALQSSAESASPAHTPATLMDCFHPLKLEPKVQELMRLLLILSAEHELNLSSFTTRCVASGQGNFHQSLIAACAALSTPAQGGQVLKTQHFIRQGCTTPLEGFFQEYLSTGQSLPMPGHPLYPEGDPRWHLFKTHLESHWQDHPRATHLLAIAQRTQAIQNTWPTLDWVLAIGAELLCPAQLNGLDWFALGRIMGWLAHIQEQYEHPEMIRPRAQWSPTPIDNLQPED